MLDSSKNRRIDLLSQYYQNHHRIRDLSLAKDGAVKEAFFRKEVRNHFTHNNLIAMDLGCRWGILTKALDDLAQWHGIDIDEKAVEKALKNGLSAQQMDISINIDFKDSCFDIVLLTEVLEHLPYPAITVKEIHRILKSGGIFLGSVPLNYNINQRLKVIRGKRLEQDPTHLHSFSFFELNTILKHYFQSVTYLPLRGKAVRFPWLSYDHFVRDIAWVAKDPISEPKPWKVKLL